MKKKVLFLIDSLSGGGAEKVLSVILNDLNRQLFEVNVCPIVDTGAYRDVVRNCAAHYSPIVSYDGGPLQKAFNRLKYKLLYSYLPLSLVYNLFVPKKNDVEIAFCEGFVTKLISHAGSKAQKMAWVHTDLEANPWPQQQGIYRNKEEERQAYLHFNKVVCVSNAVEAIMRKKYGLDNTTVIYNPVDTVAISSLSQEECPVKLDTSCFNIVAIGRLVPQKGFDRLIPIVAELTKEFANTHLFILGEGPERPRLEEMIAASDATGSIHMTGYLANPYVLMSQADLYVCSSRVEGFSLTIAEAMALGKPIVSMNCVGPAELLEQGKYGELCSTYQDLSRALRRAASDKEYLFNLRKKSMVGKNRFDKENTIELIESVITEISLSS